MGEIVRGFRANYRELIELCSYKKPRRNGRGCSGDGGCYFRRRPVSRASQSNRSSSRVSMRSAAI